MTAANSDGSSPDQAPIEAQGADRRKYNRVELNAKARVLRENGDEDPCLITNISAGGALLKAKSPPPAGEKVVLYIDSVGRFEGRVVRSGKHSFAVDYRGRKSKTRRTADSLTIALNGKGKGIDRRASPRIRQDGAAIVTLESGETVECSVLDISLTGASIEIDPRPILGAHLTVGKMKAKVVRRHEKGVGVVFTGPATKMEAVIQDTVSKIEPLPDGAEIAKPFGKKGDRP